MTQSMVGQANTERLRAEIHRHFGTDSEAAEALECHPSTLSKVLSGQRRPGLGLALRIEKVLGVPAGVWAEPRRRRPSLEPSRLRTATRRRRWRREAA